jgi:hypothetical protein
MRLGPGLFSQQNGSTYSAAGSALNLDTGFGGGNLSQQVASETEEERKKRMLGLSALQSPAAQMLLQSPFLKG